MKQLKIYLFIFICFFVIYAPAGDCQEAAPSLGMETASFPSLLSSIRIQPPLDFCGEAVPLDDPEVRERIEKELLLILWDRAQLILNIKRTARYFPYIEEKLKEHNLPDDLKYVTLVESALRPHAGSSKNAIGFWQFIRPTGLKYGLRIDNDIDERRNIHTSTIAAIRYFKKLYNDFNSWTLAAAAYNMGEAGLKASIMHQKTNNYYNLYLFLETQRYIPRIIAMKLVASNPEKYGFKFIESDFYTPDEFDRVKIDCRDGTPIQMIAEAAGTYYKVIKDLNPEIRGRLLPKGPLVMSIPKGAADHFYARFNDLYLDWLAQNEIVKTPGVSKSVKKIMYTVKRGDNLSMIAEKYRVRLSDLIVWNGLTRKSHIYPGQKLTIYLK